MDEWISVSKKKSSKLKTKTKIKTNNNKIQQLTVFNDFNFNDNNKDFLKLLNESILIVEASSYYTFVSTQLKNLINKNNDFQNIIILGLGNFMDSKNSFLQLSLVLCLKQFIISRKFEKTVLQLSFFEPLITSNERRICETLGILVLEENLYGKYKVLTKTLFYMPHCPYRLYCNVLWANWDNLDLLFIIGNRSL
jgi:hypothetical protein